MTDPNPFSVTGYHKGYGPMVTVTVARVDGILVSLTMPPDDGAVMDIKFEDGKWIVATTKSSAVEVFVTR